MRKHIAKALQTRSKAVRNALDKYNSSAAALQPPKPQLTWDQVVHYSFVSEFDLLRHACREDISEKPWATPAGRIAMDAFFKGERAKEEIQRLNVEIRRLYTWMQDLEASLLAAENKTSQTDPILAFHIHLYRISRSRGHKLHRQRLASLSKMRSFTGNLTRGKPVTPLPHTTCSSEDLPSTPPPNNGEDDDDEEGSEDEDTEGAAVEVLVIATDGGRETAGSS